MQYTWVEPRRTRPADTSGKCLRADLSRPQEICRRPWDAKRKVQDVFNNYFCTAGLQYNVLSSGQEAVFGPMSIFVCGGGEDCCAVLYRERSQLCGVGQSESQRFQAVATV
eukprot:6472532-Amphidinium_carterae.1